MNDPAVALAEAVMRDLDCADVFGHREDLTASVRRHTTPPENTRLVLMSHELFVTLGASRVDWGDPDEHGWYTPTVYAA